MLLAVVGVSIGALIAAVLDGAWHPSHLDHNVEWLW